MKNFDRFIPVITFFAGIMFTISLGLRSQDSSAYRKADTIKPEVVPTILANPEKQRVIDAQSDSLNAIADRLLKKPAVTEKEGEKLKSDLGVVSSEAKKVNRALDRMINSLVPRTHSIKVNTVMPVIKFTPIDVCPLPVDSIPVTVPEPVKRSLFKRIFH